MHAPAPRLRLAVHFQSRNRIQLPAEVEANRPDGRLISQPRSDGVAQVAKVESQRSGPHVAAVEEQHYAEIAVKDDAQFLAEREHRVAADRKAVGTQRAHLVSPPPANRCRTTEEVTLAERHERI